MNNPLDSPAATSSSVAGEVAARFGVLPNFFRLAADAPEITENLWGFAKFGYLDNPLPSLLKERLFVYLSQFCEVRYCLSRHVGFLVGLGRPAGDLQCPPETVEQIVRLIRRPFPRGEALRPHLEFCEQLGEPLADWPASETFAEEAIFACTTHVFLQTAEAPRCLAALRHALASDALEHLLVFITFVRTAHFWTKVHPELQQEQDILDLLSVHEALAECVLLEPEESNSETTQILLNELIELRKEAEQAELLRVTLASIGDAVIVTDALGKVTTLNVVAEQLAGWSKEEAYGKRAEDVFQIVHEHTRQPAECPARTVLREGRAAGPSEHTLLIAKGGASYPVDHSAAPIRNKGGSVVGCVLVFRDVTDRRRAEQQLQQSELRYRLVGQAANDAIWDWDLKTNHVAWNEGLQTRFGFPQEAVGDDSLWWVDHLHPDDRDRVVTGIHAAIDNGSELWEEEYYFRRADGGYAAVLDRGRIVRDDAGSPVRMVGSMLDLTEKRKIESDLREARSRLESTLAAAEIGTWEYDPVREVVKADQNLARMFGVSPDRAANGQLASYLDAIHPDDRQRVMKSIQHALAKADNYETEYRLLGADNSVRWVVARGRVERNAAGHAVSLPGVVMDISERKKYEKALQASEERLHLALESAELGAWNVDPETHHLTSDERFRIIFQGRTDPLTYEQAFAAIHPDDQERVRASVAAAIDPSTLAPYDEEYRVVHAGGAVRWVFAKGRANFDHVGDEQRLVSFDGTVMDITEQRQLQDDLQRVAASLSESHRRKDEFIATLSHELRNPLAPIRSGLEAMKSAAGDPELLEEIRTTMERQTQQLITLVDDLLDVSRITSGKLQLRRRRVELSEVVRNAVEAARTFVEDAEHNLTVTAPDEKIFLHADPHRLAQVLSNLLNNSTKYTPAGGSIRLTAEQDGPEVVIAVEDSGLGIPREMQERIFEMFAQVDRPQEKGYTGLGIGLSLVKSLVELHDGRIEVRSEGPGLGSEFRVRIPLSTEPDAEPASPREAPVTPPGQRKKVLVVDDNKAAAKMLKVVVGSLGAEVRTAHDGLDAIDAAGEFRPDVVLMDIGMPRMNGYDAAAGIREQPWGKSMVLVALTGWGQDEDKQRTREAGFDHHLVKPADAEAIRRVLSDVPSSDA